ncbi:MAG: PQQ-binding-like beta-propeller repeat protein [Verrucomicrobiota bacterium]
MVESHVRVSAFVLASVKGLVVGLDQKFQLVWQHQLPGETAWGRALPAMLRTSSGSTLVFSDGSGTETCLSSDGKVVWTNALAAGPCKAPPQTISLKPGEDSVLMPAGSTLFCCNAAGGIRWRRELDKEIVTQPVVLSLADRRIILCGTAAGSLFALDLAGNVLWERGNRTKPSAIGSLFFHAAMPSRSFSSRVSGEICMPLDVQGRPEWTHLFRTKTRGAPLVLDADGDGHAEIFVPTFHQRVFAFDETRTTQRRHPTVGRHAFRAGADHGYRFWPARPLGDDHDAAGLPPPTRDRQNRPTA